MGCQRPLVLAHTVVFASCRLLCAELGRGTENRGRSQRPAGCGQVLPRPWGACRGVEIGRKRLLRTLCCGRGGSTSGFEGTCCGRTRSGRCLGGRLFSRRGETVGFGALRLARQRCGGFLRDGARSNERRAWVGRDPGADPQTRRPKLRTLRCVPNRHFASPCSLLGRRSVVLAITAAIL